MKIPFKKLFIFLAVASFLIFPLTALAACQSVCPKTGLGAASCNLCKSTEGTGLENRSDVGSIVSMVIKGVVSLVGTIFFVLTIYAGYLWMTAAGEESKIESAKKILKSSIIGLVITLSAYAITAFVTSQLITGTGGGAAAGECANVDVPPVAPCSSQTSEAACTASSLENNCRWQPL